MAKDKRNASRIDIGYATVSSAKQKEDLGRQEQFIRDSCPGISILSDIGSGLNFKRKGFKKLLRCIMQGPLTLLLLLPPLLLPVLLLALAAFVAATTATPVGADAATPAASAAATAVDATTATPAYTATTTATAERRLAAFYAKVRTCGAATAAATLGSDIHHAVLPVLSVEKRRAAFYAKVRTCGTADFCGCSTRPNFGVEGSTAFFYREHRKNGMVNVRAKRSGRGGCSTRPNFGVEGSQATFPRIIGN